MKKAKCMVLSQKKKDKIFMLLILPAIVKFNFLCYLYIWSDILAEVNHAQKYLQIKVVTK